MDPIRVLVVDDSFVCRELLREILEADGDIEVVGDAATGEEAARQVGALKPQLMTMDVHMPGWGGLQAIERIMAQTPLPILVITGRPTNVHDNVAFEAVRRGALDLMEKPKADDIRAARYLRSQVRALCKIPVIRHVAGSRHKGEPPSGGAFKAEAPSVFKPEAPTSSHYKAALAGPMFGAAPPHTPATPLPAPEAFVPIARGPSESTIRVIGIGASAGGPASVVSVLSQLSKELEGAVLIAQHLPAGFSETYAEYIQHHTALSVQMVSTRAPLVAGNVYLPVDDHHIVVAGPPLVVRATRTPPVDGFRPSVTHMFDSLANTAGPIAIGVVLSGIGSDGSEGIRRLAACGGFTIAQDEATSTVYGMPRAAALTGSVQAILPLAKIGPTLRALCAAHSAREKATTR